MATDPVPTDARTETPHDGLDIPATKVPLVNARTENVAPSALIAGMSWLDRRFGKPWSAQAFRTYLGLALIYSWIAFFLTWGLDGTGRIGNVALLANPPQPARFVGSLSAITLPLFAMLIGRSLGSIERRTKLVVIRWLRRNPKQFRSRLRMADFERRYRWFLSLIFGTAIVAVLIYLRRGDVAAFTIVFSWLALGPVSGIAVARRFSNPTSQGLAALMAGFGSISGAVILILAFAGAGVSAFAFAILGVTNVAFAGALGALLDLVMGGVFTLGLALAGVGVGTVALALAGAGTGIATLTGVATMSRAGFAAFILLMGGATLATLTFSQATVLSAAIGGISALAVAAAVAHNRRGHHGAYAGAIGAIALLTFASVLLGWGDKPLVIFAVCFFFLLPLTNGLIDWFAWAMMHHVVQLAIPRRPIWLSFLLGSFSCLVIAAALIVALTLLIGFSFESYNQFTLKQTGQTAFNLIPMIDRAIRAPWGEGLWLSVILFTPIIPIAFYGTQIVTDGMLTLQPYNYPLRHLLFRLIGLALTLILIASTAWLISAIDTIDFAETLGMLGKHAVSNAKGFW